MKDELRIDRQARERAEGWVGDLARKVDEAQNVIASLSGFFDSDTLPAAAVASAKQHAQAIREQTPILLQAVRDLEEMPVAA